MSFTQRPNCNAGNFFTFNRLEIRILTLIVVIFSMSNHHLVAQVTVGEIRQIWAETEIPEVCCQISGTVTRWELGKSSVDAVINHRELHPNEITFENGVDYPFNNGVFNYHKQLGVLLKYPMASSNELNGKAMEFDEVQSTESTQGRVSVVINSAENSTVRSSSLYASIVRWINPTNPRVGVDRMFEGLAPDSTLENTAGEIGDRIATIESRLDGKVSRVVLSEKFFWRPVSCSSESLDGSPRVIDSYEYRREGNRLSLVKLDSVFFFPKTRKPLQRDQVKFDQITFSCSSSDLHLEIPKRSYVVDQSAGFREPPVTYLTRSDGTLRKVTEQELKEFRHDWDGLANLPERVEGETNRSGSLWTPILLGVGLLFLLAGMVAAFRKNPK